MLLLAALLAALAPACAARKRTFAMGQPLEREATPPARQVHGDEIVIAGRRFHTGAPVVLFSDPGGYNAYASSHFDARYSKGGLTESETGALGAAGWTLPMLQRRIDQFILHYDVCGVSARCFDVLQNQRGLSVHFLLDIDGTIYQTLDVQERAWHATKANDRSVGVEIANIGAYEASQSGALDEWYAHDDSGTYIALPSNIQQRYGPRGGVRSNRNWPLRPARDAPIVGIIQGQRLRQYDLTPQQYDSLIKLTAALHRALPAIRLDYPHGADGRVLPRVLNDAEFAGFRGVLGHWHVQENKVDPGPALDWHRVIEGARRIATNAK